MFKIYKTDPTFLMRALVFLRDSNMFYISGAVDWTLYSATDPTCYSPCLSTALITFIINNLVLRSSPQFVPLKTFTSNLCHVNTPDYIFLYRI